MLWDCVVSFGLGLELGLGIGLGLVLGLELGLGLGLGFGFGVGLVLVLGVGLGLVLGLGVGLGFGLGVGLGSDRVLGLSLALTNFCLRLGFLLSPMIGFSVKMFLSDCCFLIICQLSRMIFRMFGMSSQYLVMNVMPCLVVLVFLFNSSFLVSNFVHLVWRSMSCFFYSLFPLILLLIC